MSPAENSKEFEHIKINALLNFNEFAETLLSEYTNYLQELNTKPFNCFSKSSIAFEQIEGFENRLLSYIQTKYPKTNEVFINGLVNYPLETIIYFDLTSQLAQTRKKFYTLYKEFLNHLGKDQRTQ